MLSSPRQRRKEGTMWDWGKGRILFIDKAFEIYLKILRGESVCCVSKKVISMFPFRKGTWEKDLPWLVGSGEVTELTMLGTLQGLPSTCHLHSDIITIHVSKLLKTEMTEATAGLPPADQFWARGRNRGALPLFSFHYHDQDHRAIIRYSCTDDFLSPTLVGFDGCLAIVLESSNVIMVYHHHTIFYYRIIWLTLSFCHTVHYNRTYILQFSSFLIWMFPKLTHCPSTKDSNIFLLHVNINHSNFPFPYLPTIHPNFYFSTRPWPTNKSFVNFFQNRDCWTTDKLQY